MQEEFRYFWTRTCNECYFIFWLIYTWVVSRTVLVNVKSQEEKTTFENTPRTKKLRQRHHSTVKCVRCMQLFFRFLCSNALEYLVTKTNHNCNQICVNNVTWKKRRITEQTWNQKQQTLYTQLALWHYMWHNKCTQFFTEQGTDHFSQWLAVLICAFNTWRH